MLFSTSNLLKQRIIYVPLSVPFRIFEFKNTSSNYEAEVVLVLPRV